MCLTTEAFALFLNLIGSSIVAVDGPKAVIHATTGDVVWHAVVQEWCTAAPFAGQSIPFVVALDAQQRPPRP